MNQTIADGLSYNERKLLLALDAVGGKASPQELIDGHGFAIEVEVMGAASWLETKGLAKISEESSMFYAIGDDSIVIQGLPERKAVIAIDAAGGKLEMSALADAIPNGEDKIAVGWLKRKGLADIIKEGNLSLLALTVKGKEMLGKRLPVEDFLINLSKAPIAEIDVDKEIIKELKGRGGIIKESPIFSHEISLTEKGQVIASSGIVELKKEITDITDRLIQSGEWQDAEYRKYDVHTFAPAIYPAKRSPITRLIDQVRQMFLDMGFTEMSSEYVQPSFWNMDVLFTPQDHPARDLQDTFYLENPSSIREDDDQLVEQVKRLHE
ncbi:MAG TPA: phenylalanine--tRNA ligase subunit alpha, partial [Candidatus Methanomethylophilaceae archaeon]|nr:phenylalanine--tRNA ligase subunit alpha [Candidatus Methanomethylophilaceae archaeon]